MGGCPEAVSACTLDQVGLVLMVTYGRHRMADHQTRTLLTTLEVCGAISVQLVLCGECFRN